MAVHSAPAYHKLYYGSAAVRNDPKVSPIVLLFLYTLGHTPRQTIPLWMNDFDSPFTVSSRRGLAPGVFQPFETKVDDVPAFVVADDEIPLDVQSHIRTVIRGECDLLPSFPRELVQVTLDGGQIAIGSADYSTVLFRYNPTTGLKEGALGSRCIVVIPYHPLPAPTGYDLRLYFGISDVRKTARKVVNLSRIEGLSIDREIVERAIRKAWIYLPEVTSTTHQSPFSVPETVLEGGVFQVDEERLVALSPLYGLDRPYYYQIFLLFSRTFLRGGVTTGVGLAVSLREDPEFLASSTSIEKSDPFRGHVERGLVLQRYLQREEEAPFAPIYGIFPSYLQGASRITRHVARLYDGDVIDVNNYRIENDQGPFSIRTILSISLTVLEGLNVLHRRREVHRDVKPENVVIKQIVGGYKAALIDSASICSLDDREALSRLDGTPMYIDPFLARRIIAARGVRFHPSYAEAVTTKGDIWALGMMIWGMIYDSPLLEPGAKIVDNAHLVQFQERILQYCGYEGWVYVAARSGGYSPLLDVLAQLLHPVPAKRLNAPQAYVAITRLLKTLLH